MMLDRFHARSFTLVLTLFLTVMIVVTGGALALTGSAESLAASRQAARFDHELAVGNFVACFPQLLKAAQGASHGKKESLRFELSYDSCTITCLVSSERDKLNLASTTDPELITSKLRDVARRNGLPEKNLRIRPLKADLGSAGGNRLFWFSQIVQPTQLDEVFYWSLPDPAATAGSPQKPWSQLVTFWSSSGQDLFGLEMETEIHGRSSLRSYVVVSVAGQNARVLYQGPCS